MRIVCRQRYCKAENEIVTVSIDVSGLLSSGELATGTPTIVEVGTSDLVLSNKAISNASLDILGRTIIAGQALQFTVSNGSAGSTYTIRSTFTTDGDQTRIVDIILDVVS